MFRVGEANCKQVNDDDEEDDVDMDLHLGTIKKEQEGICGVRGVVWCERCNVL